MTSAQSKIDIEVEAMLILQKLLQFQNGVIWTASIFSDVMNHDIEKVKAGLKYLIDRGYVRYSLGSYSKTDEGCEYYESARDKSSIQSSAGAWKFEALTGIDNRGKKSAIVNGAIPRGTFYPRESSDPESCFFEKEEQQKMKAREAKAAQLLGLSVEKFRELFEDGLIKLCMGASKNDPHLGRFHRKGNGTRHMCVACMKGIRNGHR